MSGFHSINEFVHLRSMSDAHFARPEHSHRDVQAVHRAYERLQWRGRWHRLWARLRGQPVELWRLHKVKEASTVSAVHANGLQLVSLDMILGSEGKEAAFDRAFHPQQEYSRERWVSIALARASGQSLPPVELFLVDDGHNPVYFVRDGHHRISVARAYGQREIEAHVVVWQLDGPGPWASICSREPQPGVPVQQLAA